MLVDMITKNIWQVKSGKVKEREERWSGEEVENVREGQWEDMERGEKEGKRMEKRMERGGQGGIRLAALSVDRGVFFSCVYDLGLDLFTWKVSAVALSDANKLSIFLFRLCYVLDFVDAVQQYWCLLEIIASMSVSENLHPYY